MGKPKSSYSTAIVDGAAAGAAGVGLAVEAAAGGADWDSGGSSLAVESFPLSAEAAEAAEVAGTSSSFPAAMTETLLSLCRMLNSSEFWKVTGGRLFGWQFFDVS